MTECSSVGRAIDCSVVYCVSVFSEINWSLVRFRPLGFFSHLVAHNLESFSWRCLCPSLACHLRPSLLCSSRVSCLATVCAQSCVRASSVPTVQNAHIRNYLHGVSATLSSDEGTDLSWRGPLFEVAIRLQLYPVLKRGSSQSVETQLRAVVDEVWITTKASLSTSSFVRQPAGLLRFPIIHPPGRFC